MKKSVITLLTIAGISVGVGKVGALPVLNPTYQDIDIVGVQLSANNTSVTGTWDIRPGASDTSPSVTIQAFAADPLNDYMNVGTTYNDTAGFDPAGPMDVVSANVYIYLRNAEQLGDVFSIDLSDLFNSTTWIQGDGSRAIVEDPLHGLALTFLNNNGFLDYTISWGGGTFDVDYAQLQVVALGNAAPPPVPEAGSTAGLLGCAFLALGAIRRRFNV